MPAGWWFASFPVQPRRLGRRNAVHLTPPSGRAAGNFTGNRHFRRNLLELNRKNPVAGRQSGREYREIPGNIPANHGNISASPKNLPANHRVGAVVRGKFPVNHGNTPLNPRNFSANHGKILFNHGNFPGQPRIFRRRPRIFFAAPANETNRPDVCTKKPAGIFQRVLVLRLAAAD